MLSVLILFLFGLHFLLRGVVSLYSYIIMSKTLTLESIFEFIRQKCMNTCFKLSSRDEVSCRQKRVNSKRYFSKRQGWFHPGTSFFLGWNFTYKHPLTWRTRALQKFVRIQGWRLLTFFICLHNQLSSFNSIIVQMSEKMWFIK